MTKILSFPEKDSTGEGDSINTNDDDYDDDDDDDDELDKIPTHHLGFCLLGFCPLGFILHTTTMMMVMRMITIVVLI